MVEETRDAQIDDEGDGGEGNLSGAAELRGEFSGKILGELVLEDGRSDGDTKDLAEGSNEAIEGHLDGEGQLWLDGEAEGKSGSRREAVERA